MRPYRRAGFELAGVAVAQTVEAGRMPRFHDIAVDELRPEDEDGVAACYDRVARDRNGAIARSHLWWQTRVLAGATPAPHAPSDVHGFVVRDGSEIAGYVLYTQDPDGGTAYATRITCRDLVWENADAGRALFGLLGSGHPMTTTVSWLGEALDPAAFVLDDVPMVASVEPWMARLVEPIAALAEHATSPDARARLAVRIEDAFEEDWSVDVMIEVRDGHVTTEPASGHGAGRATIDTGALAAILAGSLQPEIAVATGRLVTGPDGLAPFSALLPPGRPWIGDRF